MKKLKQIETFLIRLIRDDEGASVIEYAILVALIAAFCVGAVTLLGINTSSTINQPQLNSALGGS